MRLLKEHLVGSCKKPGSEYETLACRAPPEFESELDGAVCMGETGTAFCHAHPDNTEVTVGKRGRRCECPGYC